MYRKAQKKLEEWMNTGCKKPVFLHGMKGVGKTWLVNDFTTGRFEKRIYVNLLTNGKIASRFSNCDKGFVENIEVCLGIRDLSDVLLIFDEIDKCSEFCKSIAEYIRHRDAEGPKLILISSECDYAKGLSDCDCFDISLYPFDFEEFLIAHGNQWYCEVIDGHFKQMKSIPTMIHEELKDIFDEYLITGGMPEIIARYLNGDSFNLNEYQQRFLPLIQALDDSSISFRKKQILESVIDHYKHNLERFFFTRLRKGATYLQFKDAIKSLQENGAIIKLDINRNESFQSIESIENVENVEAFENESNLMKLYLADHGILRGYIEECVGSDEKKVEELLIENAFVSDLMTRKKLYIFKPISGKQTFYVSNSTKEIFILKLGRKLQLNEIKNDFKGYVLNVVSDQNFNTKEGINYIPWYAIFKL